MKDADVEVRIHVGLAKDGKTEDHVLYRRMSKALIGTRSEAEINAQMNAELQHVSLEKAFVIYAMLVNYGYEDAGALSGHVYGDTVIQTTLPYCLHLPDGSDFEIHVPDQGFTALVTLRKIWTKKAGDSAQADFIHETRPTFFTNSVMQPPQFPIDPALGWELDYTGKNVEKVKDSNGVFRYTDVLIELKAGITATQLEEDGAAKDVLLGELTTKAIEVINRLLDTYRYVSREGHVERVGSLNVHNIYFTKENVGFYVMSMLGTGIGTAMMNLPRVTGDEIHRMLEANERPPLADLLQLDAESTLERRAYTLAVVKSFQALEIYLESYILERYQAEGLSESDASRVLDVRWRTPDRLKHLLKDVSGQAASQNAWWHEWITLYDTVRNEVLHHAKDPSQAEAERVVELNRELMAWIKGLPLANTGLLRARKILRGRKGVWQRMKSLLQPTWRRLR